MGITLGFLKNIGTAISVDASENDRIWGATLAVLAIIPAFSAEKSVVQGGAEAAPEAFTVADRVAGQLADGRLGPLAGKITPEALQDLANNPNAIKFLDTVTGNTNIVQLVEGRLLRITTAGDDAARIISVGPIQQNGLFNGIVNGRFTPLIR